ncbi:hypothetical protein [Dankookia sp. P2]|uniref:hypothetical protein n=1 Tax=Dankookia sp. P2 TaxID=3423955 RepID=UPI003D665456
MAAAAAALAAHLGCDRAGYAEVTADGLHFTVGGAVVRPRRAEPGRPAAAGGLRPGADRRAARRPDHRRRRCPGRPADHRPVDGR